VLADTVNLKPLVLLATLDVLSLSREDDDDVDDLWRENEDVDWRHFFSVCLSPFRMASMSSMWRWISSSGIMCVCVCVYVCMYGDDLVRMTLDFAFCCMYACI
jgi:hypothetical protein